MPFYEYECQSCKFYTEIMQKISDAPLKKCPSCGKSSMKKLISAPVFRLKGGGWYETDFKSDKEDKRNLASEKDADAKEAKPAEAASADTPKPPEGKPAVEPKPSQDSAKSGADSKRKGKSIAVSRKTTARARPRTKTRARKKARR
jgi:putative FmdB family regulatory protein